MTRSVTSCVLCGNPLTKEILATEYSGECPWCLSGLGDPKAAEEFCRPLPMPPEAISAPASARFGRYIRVQLLGRGGMGEVWKAWDPDLSRWVALKFLEVKTERQLAWFKQEAHIAGTLLHPNIAAVHDVGEAQGQRYIALQYVEGSTLERAQPMKARRAATLVRTAAAAVAHAHRLGIVHRDLTPSNLMLTPEGHLYVMDFGLASKAGTFSPYVKLGEIAGTPEYMSPAQWTGAPASPPDDVYALGATLRKLIAGKPPIRLKAVIDRCLAPDPKIRYADAGELARALGTYLGRKLKLVVAGIAAALLVVGGAAVGIVKEIDRVNTAERIEREKKADQDRIERERQIVEEALELTRLGERHQQKREDEAAVAAFSRAIVLHPEPRTLLFRSFSLWRLERYDACLADAERAVQLEPANQAAIRTRDRIRDYLRKR